MGKYLIRERYLKMIRAGRDDTDVIKVITGMRRCGKSVLMELYADELRRSNVPEKNIIQINFESFEFQNLNDKKLLNEYLEHKINKKGTTYVLLDEIQNVKDWELSLSALSATGRCDVYITGSNSDVLSSQLATHISGRHVEIRVFPLSFSEFMEMHNYDEKEMAFNKYLECGGLPGIDIERDQRYRQDYLQGVYNTIVVKDVLRNVNVNDPSKIEAIARFLFSNIGNITSKMAIAKRTGLPESTVGIYLKAMEDSFLILPCNRYDMIGKRLLSTNKKYYVTDLGMRKSVLGMIAETDISRPLENIVYIELLRRGYSVRVGCYHDSEVDFVAMKNNVLEYFQVCQTLMTDDTKDRELKSLTKPKDNYQKTILTLDKFGLGNENGVIIRNVIEWLIDYS